MTNHRHARCPLRWVRLPSIETCHAKHCFALWLVQTGRPPITCQTFLFHTRQQTKSGGVGVRPPIQLSEDSAEFATTARPTVRPHTHERVQFAEL